MIDTHCHLLYGLDDGPRDPRETIALAQQLRENGVTHVVCTPHFSRLFPTDHELARERLEDVRALLADVGVPLELELAAEVSPAWAVSEPFEELRGRAIRGRSLLVELTQDTSEVLPATATERLAEGGLGIVIAHPERSRAVQRRPAAIEEARAAGALVQVVASSLTGRWGGAVASAAWALLDAGRVDLLASDAHRARTQSSLAEARRRVAERYGASALDVLTRTAPADLLAGRAPGAPATAELT